MCDYKIIANDKKVLFDMTYVSQIREMREKHSFSLEYILDRMHSR
jgi:hypothetical protein